MAFIFTFIIIGLTKAEIIGGNEFISKKLGTRNCSFMFNMTGRNKTGN